MEYLRTRFEIWIHIIPVLLLYWSFNYWISQSSIPSSQEYSLICSLVLQLGEGWEMLTEISWRAQSCAEPPPPLISQLIIYIFYWVLRFLMPVILNACVFQDTCLIFFIFTYLQIYLPNPICLIFKSIYLSSNQSIYLQINQSIYQSKNLSINLKNLTIFKSIYQSINLRIYLSICLRVYLS